MGQRRSGSTSAVPPTLLQLVQGRQASHKHSRRLHPCCLLDGRPRGCWTRRRGQAAAGGTHAHCIAAISTAGASYTGPRAGHGGRRLQLPPCWRPAWDSILPALRQMVSPHLQRESLFLTLSFGEEKIQSMLQCRSHDALGTPRLGTWAWLATTPITILSPQICVQCWAANWTTLENLRDEGEISIEKRVEDHDTRVFLTQFLPCRFMNQPKQFDGSDSQAREAGVFPMVVFPSSPFSPPLAPLSSAQEQSFLPILSTQEPSCLNGFVLLAQGKLHREGRPDCLPCLSCLFQVLLVPGAPQSPVTCSCITLVPWPSFLCVFTSSSFLRVSVSVAKFPLFLRTAEILD